MLNYREIVANLLEEFATKIRGGNCKLSEDEALQIVSNIAHIAISKQEVANRYGVSQKTIERKEKDELIPPSHPAVTTKKQWYLDELLKFEHDAGIF